MDPLIIINPSGKVLTEWENFVLTYSGSNFFQSHLAYRFFNKIKNYTPLLITATEKNKITGSLLGLIIKEPGRIKEKLARAVVWGGPLAGNEEIAGSLIEKFDDLTYNKTIFIEYRNFKNLKKLNHSFEKLGYKFQEHLNYIVKIENEEFNRSILSNTRQRQLKKSLRSGVEIREAESVRDIKDFYKILYNLYKSKIKKPLPGVNFFLEFFNDSSLGKIFLIKYNNKIIGGILCPVFKDTIYEWYICGLDNEYKDQYPSVMATWGAIEYAIKNKLKYFDFMGAGKPGSEYGVREFKSKFGGDLINYGRYLKINKPTLYFLVKQTLKIYRKFK